MPKPKLKTVLEIQEEINNIGVKRFPGNTYEKGFKHGVLFALRWAIGLESMGYFRASSGFAKTKSMRSY